MTWSIRITDSNGNVPEGQHTACAKCAKKIIKTIETEVAKDYQSCPVMAIGNQVAMPYLTKEEVNSLIESFRQK